MSVSEEKKIVIRLPRLRWGFFFHLRFGIPVVLLLCIALFGYWVKAIHPYLWLSGAYVEVFSTVISCDTPGRIIEMGPQVGELVKKGQMLLCLDRDLLLAKKQQTRRIFDTLTDQAESEKERFGRVLEDYLAAINELESGAGSQEKVKKQLDLMESSQEKSATAALHLAAAQASLSDLDLYLNKAMLTAPFDGMILQRSTNPGSVVSCGEAIYILCDPERLWIEAKIPEKIISRIGVGAPVRIQLPAYPKKELTGTISWIGPATVAKSTLLPIAGQNETIPIRVTIDQPEFSLLKPGLSASIGFKIH